MQKTNLQKKLVAISAALVAFFATVLPARAAGSIRDLFGVPGGITNPNAINDILKSIFTLAFSVAGVATLAMIILGGFNFITSEGDPQKTAGAQKTIISGVIGLCIVILSVLIFNFVVTRILKVNAGVFEFNF